MTFSQLPHDQRRAYVRNMILRRDRYLVNVLQAQHPDARCLNPGCIVLVGDRPGPGAPTDHRYHHTPFYSTKHSSAWMNCLLLKEGIPEEQLLWLNAYDSAGSATSAENLYRLEGRAIVALGGNAAKWLKGTCGLSAGQFIETYHPQYWKRFRAKERYPLLDILHRLLGA